MLPSVALLPHFASAPLDHRRPPELLGGTTRRIVGHAHAGEVPVARPADLDDNGRAVVDGPQVEIGGNERYVSVSRAEFKKITAGVGYIELKQTMLPLPESEPKS